MGGTVGTGGTMGGTVGGQWVEQRLVVGGTVGGQAEDKNTDT